MLKKKLKDLFDYLGRKYTKYPEYKPDLFGKMEDMMTQVETIDGHSRVSK